MIYPGKSKVHLHATHRDSEKELSRKESGTVVLNQGQFLPWGYLGISGNAWRHFVVMIEISITGT